MNKRRKITIFFVLVLVVSLSCVAYAYTVVHDMEDEGGSNPNPESENSYRFKNYDTSQRYYGVVSSDDKIDWYNIKTDVDGLIFANLVIDGINAGFDGNVYLYASDGRKLMEGYKDGNDHIIENYYIGSNITEGYFLKVVHNAGVPKEPYKLIVTVENIGLMKASQIVNKEDLPQNLK